MQKIKRTTVSTMHYVRLVYRSALFLWIILHDNNAVMLVALIRICFNGIFDTLRMAGIPP